jgi:hypothetical protein
MNAVLRTMTFVIALALCASALAVVEVGLEIPHDDRTARFKAADSAEFAEARLLALFIEQIGLADRERKVPDRQWPYNFERLSEAQVTKGLGKGVEEIKIERYARPAGANEIVSLSNYKIEDVRKGLEPRYFEIDDVGAICVYFSSDGRALSDAIVYLRVDDDFRALTKKNADVKQRAAWETKKLRELKKRLHVKEDVVQRDGKWIIAREGE